MHALSDAELTILCEVGEMEVVNTSGQPQIMQRNAIGGKLSKDLGNLLDNEKFSDVTLVVSGLEVKAHKNILAGKFNTKMLLIMDNFASDMHGQKTLLLTFSSLKN